MFKFQGWTYAVDFPAEYCAKKTFTSCVRRRKWIRYRRYVAIDSWSAVPTIHKDASEVNDLLHFKQLVADPRSWVIEALVIAYKKSLTTWKLAKSLINLSYGIKVQYFLLINLHSEQGFKFRTYNFASPPITAWLGLPPSVFWILTILRSSISGLFWDGPFKNNHDCDLYSLRSKCCT